MIPFVVRVNSLDVSYSVEDGGYSFAGMFNKPRKFKDLTLECTTTYIPAANYDPSKLKALIYSDAAQSEPTVHVEACRIDQVNDLLDAISVFQGVLPAEVVAAYTKLVS